MTGPMVIADGNEDILVNIERLGELLRKNVNHIVIGIRSVVEVGAKRALPFLCLQYMVRVGSMKHEGFKVQIAQATHPWPWFQGCVHEVTNTIRSFNEAHLRIEVRPNLAMIVGAFEPAVLVTESATKIRLAGTQPLGSCLA